MMYDVCEFMYVCHVCHVHVCMYECMYVCMYVIIIHVPFK